MAADGSIIIDTKIDTDGLRADVVDVKKQFSGIAEAAKKLGGAILGAFSLNAIVSFGKEALSLGSDLQEVQNVVDVTFTTMNDKVNEFAENAARTAGLSETMAKQYTGTFGAMADAFGFAEGEAFEMATALTQLSGDVASFYNLSQNEAYTKLKSVFTGETESLKDLGVVMTQTALDSYALANGFGKVTADMSEQEKVALRYQFVMDQLSNASGDFVRTQDSWANQTKVLALQFDSLKAAIGEGLIAILTPAIQKVNEFIPVILDLADKFSEATKTLFSGGDTGGLKEAFDQVLKAVEPLREGVVKLWDSLQPVFSNVKDYAMTILEALMGLFGKVAGVFVDKGGKIGEIIGNIGEVISAVWSAVAPILESMRGSWSETFGEISEIVGDVIGFIVDSLHGFTEFLAGVFTGDMERAWNGYNNMFKGSINAMIGSINGLIKAVVGGLNSVIKALNKVSFTIPDWVPSWGGKTFGLNLRTVSAPQIPYLANGAVIPPNAPFMAVLGDQRHGTNIEAPEGLIRSLFREEMSDLLPAMVAGFEAVVREQQATRDTIESLDIDGETLFRSMNNYKHKLAVSRGGTI